MRDSIRNCVAEPIAHDRAAQLPMFDPTGRAIAFDGETFDQSKDGPRLGRQLDAVLSLMRDGRWRSIPEILAAIGMGSEAGISARLRDLRKPKFGCHTVERRRRVGGLWEYRLSSSRCARSNSDKG